MIKRIYFYSYIDDNAFRFWTEHVDVYREKSTNVLSSAGKFGFKLDVFAFNISLFNSKYELTLYFSVYVVMNEIQCLYSC